MNYTKYPLEVDEFFENTVRSESELPDKPQSLLDFDSGDELDMVAADSDDPSDIFITPYLLQKVSTPVILVIF